MFNKSNNSTKQDDQSKKNEDTSTNEKYGSNDTKGSVRNNGQSEAGIMNYEVYENSTTKKWIVRPTSYLPGIDAVRWVVEFNSKNEATIFKSDLIDGKCKSPLDEPESYRIPRKSPDGKPVVYVKS